MILTLLLLIAGYKIYFFWRIAKDWRGKEKDEYDPQKDFI